MERINIAIIGVGRIGQVHLRHLVQSGQVNIRYLVDIEATHSKIKDLVTLYDLQHANVISTEDIKQVFTDVEVKAVFICSPVFGQPHRKCDIVKMALAAGKHVFCEKPIDLEPAEVCACYKLAAANSKTLQCGFDKRFDVSVRKMYDKIRAGELGKLRMVKLVARELPSWINIEYLKSSGGIMIDSVIHELDLLCWLSGERPESVASFGHAENLIFKDCDDVETTMVMLKFPSGLIGYIENVRGVPYGYDQRFEVLGEKGMLCVENPSTTQLQYWNQDGRLLDTITQHGLPRFYDAYREEIHHFLDVVKGNATCEIKPEDVIFNSKLTKFCTQALKSGSVVKITEEATE